MKKILLLNGNPKANSFAHLLSDRYECEAREYAQVKRFDLSQMEFDPNLAGGYDNEQALEDCLQAFQKSVVWADHIVVVTPIWWGGLPAKLKGLFDRSFLPGFAFKFEGDNPMPTQLLSGKTSRLICTMDAPEEYFVAQARPVLEQLDLFTLQYCGMAPAEVTLLGSIVMSTEAQRTGWLQQITQLGARTL